MQSAVEQIGFLHPDPVDQQLWALSLIRDQSYRPSLNTVYGVNAVEICVPLIGMNYSILLSACMAKWVLKEPLPGMFCNRAHFYVMFLLKKCHMKDTPFLLQLSSNVYVDYPRESGVC